MANVIPSLPADYWQNFNPGKQDLEFISTYLFENETPLTENEIVPVLINERLKQERQNLLEEKKGYGAIYFPKDIYSIGDVLVFPALGWQTGNVIAIRPGVNHGKTSFSVIDVDFGGNKRSFASGLAEHKLNQPLEIAADDPQSDLDAVLRIYGHDIEKKLFKILSEDSDLVRIAGRWFPRALLIDVNEGHLNLAEAVLDEAGGTPLSTAALVAQVELPVASNNKLVEFSMNYALQEDGRFDEVGPAGEVLWCLKRLEPEDVQKIPAHLHYMPIDYDRSGLSDQMKKLIFEIDDELTDLEAPAPVGAQAVICLTYPHWRSGTLPLSNNIHGMFPTAYESPRVQFTLVDGQSGQEIPAWVVLQHRYVAGLHGFFKKYELFPGSLLVIKKGVKTGEVIINAKTRRPTRDWVRTVLTGSDGGIVFAMLKQNLATEYNERMVVAVPDVTGVDDACTQIAKARTPFSQIVESMMREMVKLNVQGHVHAQELYSAINIVHRCPPGPLLSHLAGSSRYKHVGDLHFRMAETENGDE